jgi:hypothetical protein
MDEDAIRRQAINGLGIDAQNAAPAPNVAGDDNVNEPPAQQQAGDQVQAQAAQPPGVQPKCQICTFMRKHCNGGWRFPL